MKAKLLLTLAILAMFVATTTAQNKIGDNPTTVNAASLLELESTNKGVLLPRVNLAAINTWSPLTGTAVNGMLIFNDNVAVGRGYYYWNANLTTPQWVRIANTTENLHTLNLLLAATDANTINNANFAQTWNWNTLGTNTAFTLANTGAITTGTVLAISQGTAGNSGLRFTNLTSSSTLNTEQGNVLQVNSTGDVVAAPTAIYGHIEQGIQTADHDGWILLDGRLKTTLTATQQARATTLGIGANLPDARDRVLKSKTGGAMLATGRANTTTIAQTNIPNYNLPGAWTDVRGNHTHPYSARYNQYNASSGSGNVGSGVWQQDWTTGAAGDHQHYVTVNSGGGNTPLAVEDAYLQVNTFIFLGQ